MENEIAFSINYKHQTVPYLEVISRREKKIQIPSRLRQLTTGIESTGTTDGY